LVFPCSLPAQKPSAHEQFFFDAANRERVAQKLPLLIWDDALTEAARQHALLMAKQDKFAHQLPGELPLDQRVGRAGGRFTQVGENIAMGPQAPAIHRGWMESPGHRANILDAHFTALGVGVVEENGELYSVEDFSIAVASLSIDAQEEKVAALLAAKGVRVSRDRATARKLCADGPSSAGHRSMLVLSYEAPDISALPDPVAQKIRDSGYRQASVGACEPRDNGTGIPRFRIAVVLFPGAGAK
jgi:hypothetical protein